MYFFQETLGSQTGNHDSSTFLIERSSNRREVVEVHVPRTTDGGNSSTDVAVGMRVVGDDLQATTTVLDGDIFTIGNFEIEGQRGCRVNAAQIPRSGSTLVIMKERVNE